MRVFFCFFLLALCFPVSGDALARTPPRPEGGKAPEKIIFERLFIHHEGNQLVLTIDDERRVRIEGLPTAGDFVYDAGSRTLFARLPGDVHFYAVTARHYNNAPHVFPELGKIGPGPRKAGYETLQWEVKVNGRPCGTVYTSSALTGEVGLDLSDLSFMNRALVYLVNPAVIEPCKRYVIDAALGRLTGFPVMEIGREESWEMEKVTKVAMPRAVVPPLNGAAPMTDEIRVQFLLGALPPEAREPFMATRGDLSVEEQIRALETLLSSGFHDLPE